MLKIHQRIKNERVAAGLTEDEMAEKLQIPRSTYQYWEKTDPSIEKIKQVAVALGKNDDYFFITNDESGESEPPVSQVHEDPAIYNKVLPLGDLKVTLKDYVDLLIDKANKAEEREKEYLEIIKSKLISIDTNSKEIADDISALSAENQAAHRAIMDTVDAAAEQPIGTTRAAAGIVEIASEEERVGKGRKAGVSKQG